MVISLSEANARPKNFGLAIETDKKYQGLNFFASGRSLWKSGIMLTINK